MAITGLTEEVKAYLSGMNPRKVSSKPAPVTATLGNDSAQANPSFTPTSSLDDDPMKYRYISYPRDVTQDMANGHYMLFYVNVQNKAGYAYTGADGQPVRYAYKYPHTTKYRMHDDKKKTWQKDVGVGMAHLFGPEFNSGTATRIYLTEGEFDAASL